MQPIWLRAKTTIPIATGGVVERGRLNELLGRNKSARITIIRAPGGYGKTTMLSQWVSQSDQPVAWLSIDAADNDPFRFWEYIIRAVKEVLHSDMDSPLTLLSHSEPSLLFELLIDSFLNELSSQTKNVCIVIDDYHLIENDDIHDMMTRFINYLPNTCRVYMASRTELPLPLEKWRVKSWLAEVGIEQLRFTYEEARQYYEKQNLISNDIIHSLQSVLEVTEGWAAGIQLAALARSTSIDKGWSINQFDGGHPFVAEFLLKEILETLPSSTLDFLIKTSILEQLDPVVCNILMSSSDSYEKLLEFEKSGLFIVRLHSKEPIFRYHHLFAKSLQMEFTNRYSEEVIFSTYQQAATIYHKKGDFISAIELALKGQSYEFAEEWIYASLVDVFALGQTATFIRWVQTLQVNDYPIHPGTLVMYAFALAMHYKLEEANRIISDLERLQETNRWMEKIENADARVDFLGMKAYILILEEGDIEQAVALIKKKLEIRPMDTRWDTNGIQYNIVEPRLLRTSIGMRGKLWDDEKMLHLHKLVRHSSFKELNVAGFSYGIRAETLYEKNHVEEALPELAEALRLGHHFQDSGLAVPMYLLKSRINVTKQQFVAAHAVLDYAMKGVKECHWLRILHAMKVRLFLQEGKIFRAKNEFDKIVTNADRITGSSQSFIALTYARLLIAENKHEEALTYIIEVKVKAVQEEQIATIVESAILEAITQSLLSNEDAAMMALHEALKHGSRYGYSRSFLDEVDAAPLLIKYSEIRQSSASTQWDSVPLSYVKKLVEAETSDLKQNAVIDKLTPREQEVLQLLAGGASNREIASSLFLTEGTVRVYLSTIYGKLGVSSRTQAVLFVKEQ
ncbi:LuxR C-terminal-related transcriptional regulator [Sporosarcina beigongshangi]|uniref:LuxR C-terminal-related transcriptional regulator n=1 Tax=Sporosarcina beigongshangi TaxID=2782538 RepID=UPI001BA78516|nr:LuxR C-terminal-related transcriptional regulator [Sporosarcina beigongshangi]